MPCDFTPHFFRPSVRPLVGWSHSIFHIFIFSFSLSLLPLPECFSDFKYGPRRTFHGVASSAATRNYKGASRKLSEEDRKEKEEGDGEIEKKKKRKNMVHFIFPDLLFFYYGEKFFQSLELVQRLHPTLSVYCF